MRRSSGISPFIATVLLVAITMTLGGVLYSQFRETIASQLHNPSVSLVDINVASDRQTITVLVKNDGNVDLVVSHFIFGYGASSQSFSLGGNATLLSGSQSVKPGDMLAAKFRTASATLPDTAAFTLTVVADQIARAFNVQA